MNTSLLQYLFPMLRRVTLPLSLSRALLLLLAAMQLAIGVEVTTGHLVSGSIVPNEWIPIIFGPLAGLALLSAIVIETRRPQTARQVVGVTCLASIIVGALGTFFHLRRAVVPAAPLGQRLTLELLVWAPPAIAPLMFVLMGILGITAYLAVEPAGYTGLAWGKGCFFRTPLNKTQSLFVWVGLAMLATAVSSVLDHARAGFANPWLWVPTMVGVFATTVTLFLAFVTDLSRSDLAVYAFALSLMVLVGPVGLWLHIRADLAGGPLVWERLLKGAPILAPLLFSNMGVLGAIVLLGPQPTLSRGQSEVVDAPRLPA